jgi:uncharacterized membrane protein YdjX (TVP38/TMEM64 family)
MKRYLMVMGGMILLFLALFFLVEALGVPLLVDPTPWLNQGGLWAAALGVGLLIADVLLPVPSSLAMVAHGALFGVAIGTLLSLLGSTGAAVFGFWIGRRGGKWLERLVPLDERDRANRLLERWGLLAVVVTRPIPLLAETVAIMAGASPLGWLGTTLAAPRRFVAARVALCAHRCFGGKIPEHHTHIPVRHGYHGNHLDVGSKIQAVARKNFEARLNLNRACGSER